MPTLGKFIQRRRAELGLTQEQLAERVGGGVRQAEISRLEHDRVTLPRRQRLEHIAAALDVPIGELLARSGWSGAEQLDGGNGVDPDHVEELRARNEELATLAERLESTVNVLATTNVGLRSQVLELESMTRRRAIEEDMLQSVLDGVTDPVVVIGEDGDVVTENAAFAELREGSGGLEHVTTPSGEPIVGAIASFRPTISEDDLTTTIVVHTGDTRSWHEVHVRPSSLANGKRISVVTVKVCDEPGGEGASPCPD
jgi:transcriptional regulator with XRE-family HTH domain